jgi:hypothetical protein
MSNPNPLNVCIYCGRNDVKLTDEHIVPYGLGNNTGDILHKASCEQCADATKLFEQRMQRDNLQPIRTVLQIKSRSGTPTTIPQRVRFKDGHEETIEVPFNVFVGSVSLPVFTRPAIFSMEYDKSYLTMAGMCNIDLVPNKNTFWYEKQDIDEIYNYFIKTNKGQVYAKFLYKIAYCVAVKTWGYDTVKGSAIPLIILGKNSHYAVWLGCDDSLPIPTQIEATDYYWYGATILESGRRLVSIQLFPSLINSPIYRVIV